MATESKGERVRVHIWVSGNVQGVCFRAVAKDEAAFRGVPGWIWNAPDGRVDALVESTQTAVEAMIKWCPWGSPASRVTGVDVAREAPRGDRGFRVRS